MNNTNTQDARPIPPLPGGGSWTFDEAAWAWVSNDPTPPEPTEQPSAAFETHSAEQE